MFKNMRRYRNPKCLDVDIFVLKAEEKIDHTVLRVLWLHRKYGRGNMIVGPGPDEVRVKAIHYDDWWEVA